MENKDTKPTAQIQSTQKHSFKLREGEALDAIKRIVETTSRHITGALEYLIIKGYKFHKIEQRYSTIDYDLLNDDKAENEEIGNIESNLDKIKKDK